MREHTRHESEMIRAMRAQKKKGFAPHLTLGRRANETRAVGRDGDDRRRRASALGVLDHARRRALHDGHARVLNVGPRYAWG